MTKKILAALLAAAMCLALAACAGTTTPVEDAGEASQAPEIQEATEAPAEEPAETAAAEEEPETAVDTSEFIVINHVVLGDPDGNGNWEKVQDEANKYLESQINTHHELNWTGWTDYKSKYDMMVASGEELDLVDCAST